MWCFCCYYFPLPPVDVKAVYERGCPAAGGALMGKRQEEGGGGLDWPCRCKETGEIAAHAPHHSPFVFAPQCSHATCTPYHHRLSIIVLSTIGLSSHHMPGASLLCNSGGRCSHITAHTRTTTTAMMFALVPDDKYCGSVLQMFPVLRHY